MTEQSIDECRVWMSSLRTEPIMKCFQNSKKIASIDCDGSLKIHGTREEIEQFGKADYVTLTTSILLLRIMDLERELAATKGGQDD